MLNVFGILELQFISKLSDIELNELSLYSLLVDTTQAGGDCARRYTKFLILLYNLCLFRARNGPLDVPLLVPTQGFVNLIDDQDMRERCGT